MKIKVLSALVLVMLSGCDADDVAVAVAGKKFHSDAERIQFAEYVESSTAAFTQKVLKNCNKTATCDLRVSIDPTGKFSFHGKVDVKKKGDELFVKTNNSDVIVYTNLNFDKDLQVAFSDDNSDKELVINTKTHKVRFNGTYTYDDDVFVSKSTKDFTYSPAKMVITYGDADLRGRKETFKWTTNNNGGVSLKK